MKLYHLGLMAIDRNWAHRKSMSAIRINAETVGKERTPVTEIDWRDN